MEKFVIEGGYPLSGEFTPSGNKNAVLPMLAACLLTEEPVLLHNVPDIQDVQNMRKLITRRGTSSSPTLDAFAGSALTASSAPLPEEARTRTARIFPR